MRLMHTQVCVSTLKYVRMEVAVSAYIHASCIHIEKKIVIERYRNKSTHQSLVDII